MKTVQIQINRVPSIKAQESGEVESIVVELEAVVVPDGAAGDLAAVAAVAAKHGATLAKIPSPQLKVIVHPIG